MKKSIHAADCAANPSACCKAVSPLSAPVLDFVRNADAAARDALPDGEAVRLSSGGFVTLCARIVLPVNVAAALEWHDEENDDISLPWFVWETIACGLECELMGEDTMPVDARAKFRLPADRRLGYDLDRFAAVPCCQAEFVTPSADEIGRAVQALARHFEP